jgi:biopolymer transport protein ExbD
MADHQDAPLSAAQRSKIRRLSAPHEPEPGEEAGELNVVPYLDIITNIMMFVLASVSVSFIGSIDTSPPASNASIREQITSKALNLTALITSQGVSLKTSRGNVATGCDDVGPGIAIPKNGPRYDLAALTACAKKLKSSDVAFKDETQVTLVANPGIDLGTVVDVMDALRISGEEELFPDVHFGEAR